MARASPPKPPASPRSLVCQQGMVAYVHVLQHRLHRTRQGWFATLARLEQQNQQLLQPPPPDDRVLQFHQDLSAARSK